MEKATINAASVNTAAFFSLINHPVKFRLYLLRNLPAAYFSGLRIKEADEVSCQAVIPYKWFTKNPFRSTYFACLSMAAELSTGVLAMAHLHKRRPRVSMLVTAVEGKFYKKATGLTTFYCSEGTAIRNSIEAAITSQMPQELKAHSIGKNDAGETVAEFWITWSFRVKQ